MRNATKQAPALKPRSSVAERITDTLVHIPMHGGGSAAIAVQGVTRGNTTTIKLASAYTGIVGQTIKLESLGTITALNGYAKVIDLAPSDSVVIDVDSSTFPAWTAGGSMLFNVISDRMGNLAPQNILGTVTGIWDNKENGLTTHSAGTNTGLITTGLDAFNLAGFAGHLVLAFEIYMVAIPSDREQLFSLGVQTGAGTNTAAGTIGVAIETSGVVQTTFRPAAVSDGGASNTYFNTGGIGTATKKRIAFVFDLASSPTSAMVHTFIDGVLRSSTTLTMTGAIGSPANTVGLAIGAEISPSLSLTNKLGSSTTSSQARIANLLWWKSSKGFADTVEAVRRFGVDGELNELMV